MTGGRASRQKGDRAERALVNYMRDAGLACERCPSSGADIGTKYAHHDIRIPMLGRTYRAEAKHHGNGFARLYAWLEPVDLLIVRRDYSEPLVVLPLRQFIDLVLTAEKKK